MTADEIEPGVYFDMPDDVYHAIPALSASGIKNLLISQTDYWARTPWLNPLYREEEDSIARLLGRAYHTRILEGKAKFDTLYAPMFAPDEDCLDTVDDIKDALDAANIPFKRSMKKAEVVEFANDVLPEALLYDIEIAKYQQAHKGKTYLQQQTIDNIEVAAAMIEKHPELSKCFTGGYPEVSVVWEEGGVRFKSRFDYLKPKAIIDLKSFANQMCKPIDRAIYSAMANYKYHIQAAFYLEAVIQVRSLLAQGKVDIEPDEAWLEQLMACEEHGFYFVFQSKGIAPLARGKKFERGMVYGAGIAAIQDAIAVYKRCMAKFGTDCWIDEAAIDSFHDDEFPVYTTEL